MARWLLSLIVLLLCVAPARAQTPVPSSEPAATEDAPPPVDLQLVTVSGSMRITDDEIFGDEHRSDLIQSTLGLNAASPAGHFALNRCAGDETVADIALDFSLAPDGTTAVITGEVMLLEGASCATDDVEDRAPVALSVPSDTSAPLRLELRSGGFGGGDHAEIDLVVENRALACDRTADADCDGYADSLEAFLFDNFRPALAFDENEQVADPGMYSAVYQVSPVVGPEGRRGAMITVVALYIADLGLRDLDLDGWDHLTCGPVLGDTLAETLNLINVGALGSHAGDSEAARLFVEHTGEPVEDIRAWNLSALIMKQHFDPWERVETEALERLVADPITGLPTHPVLWVSDSKHAMYPSGSACEGYTETLFDYGPSCEVHFENCGGGRIDLLDLPASHNVGERHAPVFDRMGAAGGRLQALYPDEHVWTESSFCGGVDNPEAPFVLDLLPFYDLIDTHECAGSLAGKWWPPASEVPGELTEFALDLSAIAGTQALAAAAPTDRVLEIVPLDEVVPGEGVLDVLDPGAVWYEILLAGSGEILQRDFGTRPWRLPPGQYLLRQQGASIGPVDVLDGQRTVLQLDTGTVDVTDPGAVWYDIRRLGADAALTRHYGDGRFGLRGGQYELVQQGRVSTFAVREGQITTVALPTGSLEIADPGAVWYDIQPAGADEILTRNFGNGRFGFVEGAYEIHQQGNVTPVSVHAGETTQVALPTGTLEIADPGAVWYDIHPAGADEILTRNFGNGRFGFVEGAYEIHQQGNVTPVSVHPGETTQVALPTGSLEVLDPNAIWYDIVAAGTDVVLARNFGNGRFGFVEGSYEIRREGVMVNTVTVRAGETISVQLP